MFCWRWGLCFLALQNILTGTVLCVTSWLCIKSKANSPSLKIQLQEVSYKYCKVLVTCNSSQKTFIPVILKIHLGEKTLLNTPSFLGKVVFQFIKCKYWYYTVIIFTAKENLCHSHVIHLVESNIVKKTWSNLGDVTM